MRQGNDGRRAERGAMLNGFIPGVIDLFGVNVVDPMSLTKEAVPRNEGSS